MHKRLVPSRTNGNKNDTAKASKLESEQPRGWHSVAYSLSFRERCGAMSPFDFEKHNPWSLPMWFRPTQSFVGIPGNTQPYRKLPAPSSMARYRHFRRVQEQNQVIPTPQPDKAEVQSKSPLTEHDCHDLVNQILEILKTKSSSQAEPHKCRCPSKHTLAKSIEKAARKMLGAVDEQIKWRQTAEGDLLKAKKLLKIRDEEIRKLQKKRARSKEEAKKLKNSILDMKAAAEQCIREKDKQIRQLCEEVLKQRAEMAKQREEMARHLKELSKQRASHVAAKAPSTQGGKATSQALKTLEASITITNGYLEKQVQKARDIVKAGQDAESPVELSLPQLFKVTEQVLRDYWDSLKYFKQYVSNLNLHEQNQKAQVDWLEFDRNANKIRRELSSKREYDLLERDFNKQRNNYEDIYDDPKFNLDPAEKNRLIYDMLGRQFTISELFALYNGLTVVRTKPVDVKYCQSLIFMKTVEYDIFETFLGHLKGPLTWELAQLMDNQIDLNINYGSSSKPANPLREGNRMCCKKSKSKKLWKRFEPMKVAKGHRSDDDDDETDDEHDDERNAAGGESTDSDCDGGDASERCDGYDERDDSEDGSAEEDNGEDENEPGKGYAVNRNSIKNDGQGDCRQRH